MKKVYLVLLGIRMGSLCLAQTLILEESFETDGNGSRYIVSNSFFDAKDDYFGRIYGPTEEFGASGSGDVIDVSGTGMPGSQNGIYTGYNGNFFIGGEDQDNIAGDGSDEKNISFTLDISNASGLTFKGLFAAGNIQACGSNVYDQTDYIKVFYTLDGGLEQEGLCFNNDAECNGPGDNSNEPLHHDTDCDGDGGEGAMLTNTFIERSFSIPDGDFLTLRIETHADLGNEEVAYDWIRVEATTITLPVEWLSFETEAMERGIQLNWQTAWEKDNDYFEIERSFDAVHWDLLEILDAKGNSQDVTNYSYIDLDQGLKGLIYYRIKQVDLDGSFSYSPIRKELIEAPIEEITLFPNPADQYVRIQCNQKTGQLTEVLCWGVDGRLWTPVMIQQSDSDWTLDVSSFPSGTYWIQLTSDGRVFRQKLIKP
jgi:hypothetical protein